MRAARANTSLTAQSNVSRCRGLPKQNQFRFFNVFAAGLGLGLDFGWTKLGFHASFTNVFVCLELGAVAIAVHVCQCCNVAFHSRVHGLTRLLGTFPPRSPPP